MIWFLFLPLDTLAGLLAFPLAPIIALFADGKGDVTLGKRNILRMWLTPDNPIEGDRGHYARWADFVSRHPKTGLYVQRVAWMWRNKAYGWAWNVFHTPLKAGQKTWSYRNADDTVWLATTSLNPITARWMVYLYVPSFGKKYLRVYCGWKMQSFFKRGGDYKAMFVFCINPFKS
jgi:hypothetical protein